METNPARDRDDAAADAALGHGAAVERAVTLDADPTEAWELLTRPDDLAGWLGADVELEPVPGATGVVVDHDGTRRRLVIDEVEHESRISWRWWVDGDDHAASSVEITLSPVTDGTRIAVVERPLPGVASVTACASTHPVAATLGARAAWAHRLLHLELLLLTASLRVG